VVRADIESPERRIRRTFLLRRNTEIGLLGDPLDRGRMALLRTSRLLDDPGTAVKEVGMKADTSLIEKLPQLPR
jgi:hypothetical protein